MTIGSFFITVLDLEHGQVVEAADFKSYTLSENSMVKVTEPTSDKYKVRFESTGDKDDVPKGGNKLTGEQMKLQVSMYFEQVSTFHLKFGVEGEEKESGHNFLFTGATEVSHVLPDTKAEQQEFAQEFHGAQLQLESLAEMMSVTEGQHSKSFRHHNHQRNSYAEQSGGHERKKSIIRVEPGALQEEST